MSGAAAYGPRVWLPPGSYRATVDFTLAGFPGAASLVSLLLKLGRVAQFYIAAGGQVLAKRSAFVVGPRQRSISFRFSVASAAGESAGLQDLEAWVWTSGLCELAISKLEIDPLAEAQTTGRTGQRA